MEAKKIKTKLLDFDDLPLDTAAQVVCELAQNEAFSFVVTPNIDHLSRLCGRNVDHQLLDIYQKAALTLCDSRILQKLMAFSGKTINSVVPGSDLTVYLFENTITASDKVLIVGGHEGDVERLRELYPDFTIDHINPSMGFINKPEEVEELVASVCSKRANYIFLAVGSPRQEYFAGELVNSGLNTGVALCIGASINFILGVEKRAPKLFQVLHMEWFYRMCQDPMRLLNRYWNNFLSLREIYKTL